MTQRNLFTKQKQAYRYIKIKFMVTKRKMWKVRVKSSVVSDSL